MRPFPAPVTVPIPRRCGHASSGQFGQQSLRLFLRYADEQTARGLGIGQDQFGRRRDPVREGDVILHVGQVVDRSTGNRAGGHEIPGRGQHRHLRRRKLHVHAAAGGHLAQVAEQAEARDVGAGVDAHGQHGFGGVAVQGRHHVGRLAGDRGLDEPALDRRGDDSQPDGLGQHQHVAHLGAAVAQHTVGVNRTGDRQAELGFGVLDGVSTEDGNARLGRLVLGAAQDLLEDHQRQTLVRKTDDVQGEQRPGAHGVDIRQRVGRRDGPEAVGVIDDGREEVGGLDDGQLVAHPVDGGIVAGVHAHEHGRVRRHRQLGQHLLQHLRAQLASAAHAVGCSG